MYHLILLFNFDIFFNIHYVHFACNFICLKDERVHKLDSLASEMNFDSVPLYLIGETTCE